MKEESLLNNPDNGKDWWRNTRLPMIEKIASKEIARYEKTICKINTPWIPVDNIVEKLWRYEILFDRPEKYGALPGALAVLRPDKRLIVISDRTDDRTRADWNAAHEGAHILLHISFDSEAPQKDTNAADNTDNYSVKRSVYCRDKACGFVDGPEQPYMYREAEYFAGCLLMPKDKYEPLAIKRLAEALDECMGRARLSLQEIESNEGLRMITYTQVIEFAVNKMAAEDLNGSVSKQAQMIRLLPGELGLISEIKNMNYRSFNRSKIVYELSEYTAAAVAKELGLDYSPEWRV